VRVLWGTYATGTLLATGKTDSGGNLKAPVRFTVPKGASAGTYQVTSVDAKSMYPVWAWFVVK
jgi:hypothetical protein